MIPKEREEVLIDNAKRPATAGELETELRAALRTIERTAGTTRRIWPFELWLEYRDIFKALVAHSFAFGLLMVSLEGAHRLLSMMTLELTEIYWLNKTHFYMHLVTLVIFGVSFVIKLMRKEFGGTAS